MKRKIEEKTLYEITDEMVQNRALVILNRRLTKTEINDIQCKLFEDGSCHIINLMDESINEVTEWNELMRINKLAKNQKLNYLVYWKNGEPHKDEYHRVFTGLTKEDAEHFVRLHDKGYSCEKYRVVKACGGKEIEIKITNPYKFETSSGSESAF
jgi:hypothetical protein